MLLFYSVRMFRTACTGNRLDILRFMLAHGFEMEQVGVRDILHFAIEEIVDEQEAEAAQPLIRFLVEAGADVNWQVMQCTDCDLLNIRCYYTASLTLELAYDNAAAERPVHSSTHRVSKESVRDRVSADHLRRRRERYCNGACTYLCLSVQASLLARTSSHRLLPLSQNDEMPLTCAEQLTSEPLANYSPIDLEQNRLLLSLLEEHNARRTWRKIKQSKAPLAPETKPARKILSISGGFSFSRQPEEPQQQDGTTATAVVGIAAIAAATAGIMLDTPEQEAHSVQPGPLDPVDGLQC